MTLEPLPFDRKDIFKERKPSSSDPAGVVPLQWREPPTTPSSHPNNHGLFSYRWGGAGGSSDFRRPLFGHGKQVGGGLNVTTVYSAPFEDKFCRNDNTIENNHSNSLTVLSSSQKDQKRGNSWEITVSPNGSSHPFKEEHDKNAVTTTGGQRLECENSLGVSIGWKSLKWDRSGSLSSRGSGFSYSGSSKSIGVDSHDIKIDSPAGNSTPAQSPSGDAALCLTPMTPADEVSSRKKPRLGWGEGLAKYEKKKVGPDDIVDKDVQGRNGMVDCVSISELLLPSPANVTDKSPSLTDCSECASPATSCPLPFISSPGLSSVEEKAAAADNDVCNPSAPLRHASTNHTEGPTFSLESLELTEGFNLSSSVDELLQSDGFLRCTAMDKLQVWKADISRTLEVTESEIDSLENELKLLISNVGGSSASSPTECSEKSEPLTLRVISSGDTMFEKTDGFVKRSEAKGLERESPGTSTPICVSDEVSENTEAKCSQDKLYELILSSNRLLANQASDEFSNLLPSSQCCSNFPKITNELLIKEKFATRKRFLKFKERATALKFRAFQYFWKEDLRLLSVRRSGSKSLRKNDFGCSDNKKYRSSLRYRLSSAGSFFQDQTAEIVDYLKKLLSDSQVRICRNALKMPAFILDRGERMATRFITDNRLVENPIDVEKERSIINSWTIEEKETFLDKYSLFGKNFKKIASFLEHKTIADCVEFYYKNHKSDLFQKTKDSGFSKGKSGTANTYLITSGRRSNRKVGATSLEMLGAASAMLANDQKLPCGNDSISETSIVRFCNEQETVAADVLAGICGSISSEALGSCITSSGDVHKRQKLGGTSKRLHLTPDASSLNDVDEETCSDDSCGEDTESSDWTDKEKSSFMKAMRIYGKDFSMISSFMRTRSSDQCRVFFSKSRKCLRLDLIDLEPGSEGGHGHCHGHDHDDHDRENACMVDSGSVVSRDNDKSSSEGKTSSDSDQNAVNLVEERSSNVDLEGAADSETVNVEEALEHSYSPNCATDMNSPSSSDFKIGETLNKGTHLDLNNDNGSIMKLNASEEPLFPEDHTNRKKTLSHDDVAMSSRLSFRKSSDRLSQRSLSTEGYHFHLPKHSLLDSPQISHVHTSPDLEKPSGGGDVKLFGQILTKSSSRLQRPQRNDQTHPSNNVAVHLVENNNVAFGSYGFWDGSRIHTLPDSAILQAKYPAAFSNNIYMDQHHSNHRSGKRTSNGAVVSDPVAAIRMHYANYKTGS